MEIVKPTYEDRIGVITSAPHSPAAGGYSFALLDDGRTVYVGRQVTAEAGLTGGNVGDQARVRFIKNKAGTYNATRVTLLNVDLAGCQSLADRLVMLEGLIDQVLDVVDDMRGALTEQGCVFPDDEAD